MLCLQVEVFKVSHRLFGGGRGSGLSVLTQGHPVCHGRKCHRLTFHSVPLTIASQTASWGVTGSTLPPATPVLKPQHRHGPQSLMFRPTVDGTDLFFVACNK